MTNASLPENCMKAMALNSLRFYTEGAVMDSSDRKNAYEAFKSSYNIQIHDSNLEEIIRVQKTYIPSDTPKDIKIKVEKRNRMMLRRAREDHEKMYLFKELEVIAIEAIQWADKESKRQFYKKEGVDYPRSENKSEDAKKSENRSEEEKSDMRAVFLTGMDARLRLLSHKRVCVLCDYNKAEEQSHPLDDRVSCAECREEMRMPWEPEEIGALELDLVEEPEEHVRLLRKSAEDGVDYKGGELK
jgi:hypothetical protein